MTRGAAAGFRASSPGLPDATLKRHLLKMVLYYLQNKPLSIFFLKIHLFVYFFLFNCVNV